MRKTINANFYQPVYDDFSEKKIRLNVPAELVAAEIKHPQCSTGI